MFSEKVNFNFIVMGYTFEYLSDFNKLRELESIPIQKKSNLIARSYRSDGNTLFKTKTTDGYLDALKQYNKSICFAELNTEDVSIGFANRSAVLFELGLYDLCLTNIEMAQQEEGFPDRLAEKLRRRACKCREQKMDTNRHTLQPMLSFQPHKTVPFIADCLGIKKNNKYGRHVVTNHDIRVGQILAIEEPFCTTITADDQYNLCYNCGLQNCMSLIPCENCPHVMFCSSTCYAEGTQRFHRFECNLMDFLQCVLIDNYMRNTVRLFLCAITSFDTVTELTSFIKQSNICDSNVFNTDYVSVERFGFKYGPVYSMQEGLSTPYSDKVCQILSHVAEVLLTKTDLKNIVHSAEQSEIIVGIMKHHHHTNLLNSCVVRRVLDKLPQDNMMTKSIYSFCSMINHSCAQNVMITGYGNKIILSAIRPIKSGEQLFDNYG